MGGLVGGGVGALELFISIQCIRVLNRCGRRAFVYVIITSCTSTVLVYLSSCEYSAYADSLDFISFGTTDLQIVMSILYIKTCVGKVQTRFSRTVE